MPASPATRHLQARKAAADRYNHPDREDLARDFAAAKLADEISQTVAKFPPLTDEQCSRLARLLRAGAA
jgi:hypothetical protein